MNAPRHAAPAPAADFRPGALALRIRRGTTQFLIPRAWVRSVAPITQVAPLPRVKPWVLGMALHADRPVPLLDPAAYAGAAADGIKAAVLIGRSDGAGLALVATDVPGRFVSVPATAYLESGEGWLARLHGCPAAAWWLEAERLTTELKS
ncbi:chemotaxis protein CheW [Opitutus sp. ER46]|uniref:chemotaxis protein CheW n=1 Tax=Opitutus sp. ER46 TaxID=2161864 RepID=UPI000D302340|nr:chemotaxis protein CheW [Opitutus sp. ER46]PTX90712.1 hypothetical protein DB354_18795 [Opitutus sp. ER46]